MFSKENILLDARSFWRGQLLFLFHRAIRALFHERVELSDCRATSNFAGILIALLSPAHMHIIFPIPVSANLARLRRLDYTTNLQFWSECTRLKTGIRGTVTLMLHCMLIRRFEIIHISRTTTSTSHSPAGVVLLSHETLHLSNSPVCEHAKAVSTAARWKFLQLFNRNRV